MDKVSAIDETTRVDSNAAVPEETREDFVAASSEETAEVDSEVQGGAESQSDENVVSDGLYDESGYSDADGSEYDDGNAEEHRAPERRTPSRPPLKMPVRAEGKSATFDVPDINDENMSDGDLLVGVRPTINYHISDFDGPLDLLVELINKAKIAVEDIFISDVTRQYVEIVTNTPKEELDYEYAGEFITLAAKLVYLKSLRTLPNDDDMDEYFEDPDEQRRDLINKIKAYALMKEQAEKLRESETINRFYRAPTYTEKDYRVVLTNFSLPKLVEAFARVLVNMDRREIAAIPKKVVQDRFSVADQMQNIHRLIGMYGSFTFTSLFEPDFTRSDIVTTFLAVLELLKYGKLRAEQEELFGEIMLYAAEGDDGTPVNFEEETDGQY